MDEMTQLRQMPEIQSIAEYLRDMQFKKKAFGGCALESVYEHFAAVSQMYEAIICAYMQQVEHCARQSAGAAPAPAMPPAAVQPPAPMYPQPMPQPYAHPNPWEFSAWSPSPWAQRPVSQQQYYPAAPPQPMYQHLQPQPVQSNSSWTGELGGLPEPAFTYA